MEKVLDRPKSIWTCTVNIQMVLPDISFEYSIIESYRNLVQHGTSEYSSRPMALGICRLCRSSADLCESHIIPNSYFRRIKRGNDGKLISFDDSTDGLVDQSIVSWSESLLCRQCEQKFSIAESYSIRLMEDTHRGTPKREEGALFPTP